MILGMLLVASFAAQAESLRQRLGDPAEAHYALCRRTEQEAGEDLQRIVGVWKACLGEAERLSLSAVLPAIRGNLALTSAMLDASRLTDRSEEERLEIVLTSVARQRDVQFRLESLAELYRHYLVTDRGRSRMADYRDITFRWSDSAAKGTGFAGVDDVVRRYVEDAGFRWAEFGSQAGVEADVVCRGAVRARVMEPNQDALAQLPSVETIIAIDTIRLVRTGGHLQGFLTSRSAQASTEAGAMESALHGTAQAMAATLLHLVIQTAFAGAADLEEQLDPDLDVIQ